MPDIPTLSTPRLILRPLELADADAVQALFPHWEIVRFLGHVPWPYPPDGALCFIRDKVLPGVRARDRVALVDPPQYRTRAIDRRDLPPR